MNLIVLRRTSRAMWPTIWLSIGCAALGVALLIVHGLVVYRTFFFDDSFISLRYADRLRSGQGLTWTDGERVEGYTNFLWVVLLAALGRLGGDLIVLARVLGLACGGLAIAGLSWAYRPKQPRQLIAPLYGALALALSGPFAAWCVGGLEQPLLVALVGWAAALMYAVVDGAELGWRRAIAIGLLLGLACLTRPDAPLFVVALTFGLLLGCGFRKRAWIGAARMLVLPLLMVAAQLAFRRAYYDAWLPNTATKLATSWQRVRLGRDYVTAEWELRFGLIYPALGALGLSFMDRGVRRRVLLLSPALAGWLAYVVAIGGDFMPQKRHLVPAVFLIAMLGSEAMSWLVRRAYGGPASAWFLGPALAVHLGISQLRDPAVQDANNSSWYWAARPIGKFFRAAFADRNPLLAVDAAGALPYFSKLRTLDMLGLNDRQIATRPPKVTGIGVLGHELGDGAYVLGRKPDLVVFHLPWGQRNAIWRSGLEMQRMREFVTSYKLVQYRTGFPFGVQGVVYVRHVDGPLAIERTPSRIVVPGYLLGDDTGSFVELAPSGKVGVRVERSHRARFRGLVVGAGHWELSPDADGALVVEVYSVLKPLASSLRRAAFDVAGATATIEIRLSLASGTVAHVERVVLEKR